MGRHIILVLVGPQKQGEVEEGFGKHNRGSEMQTQISGQAARGPQQNASNTNTWQRWEQDSSLRRHVVDNM